MPPLNTEDVRKMLREELDERLAPLVAQVERHARTLYADNGEKGMVIRMDRAEQREKNRSRLVWLLVAAVVGLGGNVAADWIKPVLNAAQQVSPP